jgi:hypothetical protein
VTDAQPRRVSSARATRGRRDVWSVEASGCAEASARGGGACPRTCAWARTRRRRRHFPTLFLTSASARCGRDAGSAGQARVRAARRRRAAAPEQRRPALNTTWSALCRLCCCPGGSVLDLWRRARVARAARAPDATHAPAHAAHARRRPCAFTSVVRGFSGASSARPAPCSRPLRVAPGVSASRRSLAGGARSFFRSLARVNARSLGQRTTLQRHKPRAHGRKLTQHLHGVTQRGARA